MASKRRKVRKKNKTMLKQEEYQNKKQEALETRRKEAAEATKPKPPHIKDSRVRSRIILGMTSIIEGADDETRRRFAQAQRDLSRNR